jgi:hypothetical protein
MALLGLAWVGKGVELAEELVEEELDDDGGRGRGTARDVSRCGRGRVRFCCLRTRSPLLLLLLLLLLLVLPAAVPSGS